MRIAPTFNVALRALRRNKMRSVLTALGIIIGVGAVIAMVGIGNGAKAQVEAQIASLGENVILIFSGSTTSSGIRTGWGGAGTLKIEDAEAIRREVPGVIGVSEEVVSTTQVAAGNQNWFTRIFGESADYFDIRQWPLSDGAPFTPQDVRSANKVCVIGRTTATQIYGHENPIGQILRIKNVPFTITGVLTPKGLSPQGVDQDDIVVMPYTSAMKRVIGGTTLRNINVQIGDPGQIPAAQQWSPADSIRAANRASGSCGSLAQVIRALPLERSWRMLARMVSATAPRLSDPPGRLNRRAGLQAIRSTRSEKLR